MKGEGGGGGGGGALNSLRNFRLQKKKFNPSFNTFDTSDSSQVLIHNIKNPTIILSGFKSKPWSSEHYFEKWDSGFKSAF